MTSSNQTGPEALIDVLNALALAKPVPDAAVLETFVRRYPEHAEALTEFAIELALDASLPDSATETPAETSAAVSKAMSRFHNELYAVSTQSTPRAGIDTSAPADPFSSLDRTAIRELAERLNANSVFVMKLRDRHIREDTMTTGFRLWLASGLGVSSEVVAAHLAQPPAVPTHAHFKADLKPAAPSKQSFEDAVRASSLLPEQQAFLLKL